MNSVNLLVVGGALALAFGAGCGGDDGGGSGGSSTGGSGGAGTGGSGTGGSGTGGSGTGGAAGSASGGAAGSGSGGAAGSGTGGSSTGGSGGGGGTHQTCTDAGAKLAAQAKKLGCTDNSTEIKTGCEGLYTANACVAEWEALMGCVLALPDSAWECGGKGTPDFKAGNCTAERAAFDGCTKPK
ncbi:MAG: hypothetical protein IPI67_32335 [Myxococcales bacterium]|nr:hypothetical protein [Myxococcales bacterium]